MKILVVKRDKVGDLLLATPMLQALREALPDARIDVLASDYNAWVVGDCPWVDRLWVYRRARVGKRVFPGAALGQLRLWWQLRRIRYDVAIAANGEASLRATRRALYAGARRTIAYSDRTLRGLSDALAPPSDGHERDRLLRLLAPLGIEMPRDPPPPQFTPPAAVLEEARQWLREEGLAPGGYVVIGLGARRARKQPLAQQVLRWSAALRSRHGLATVFMWTPGAGDNPSYPGDDAAAAEVLAAGAAGIHPFRGPLLDAVGLVWNARTSVFPDSGLMHLAAASPGGVLGFFAEPEASPPPEQWGPLGPRAQCLVAAKRVGDISDADVLERIDALIDAGRAFNRIVESTSHTGSD
ncbi:MAG: glycosyltransferase family 9 protein [Usitatibacter sp.]